MIGTESALQPEPELVFLSHAGTDTQAAKELASVLRQAGLEVWLDVDCLQPGDVWADELERALQRAGALVLYLGQFGVLNWLGREVRYALDRNTREPSFRLIPILGRGSQQQSLPPFLSQQQYLDLREGIASPEKLKELISGIKRQPKETVSLLSPLRCPYRGLLPFETEDTLLFYGRDREISELLAKMATGRFLAVVGDSGSGKSSLVKAGLIPALHCGGFSFGSLGYSFDFSMVQLPIFDTDGYPIQKWGVTVIWGCTLSACHGFTTLDRDCCGASLRMRLTSHPSSSAKLSRGWSARPQSRQSPKMNKEFAGRVALSRNRARGKPRVSSAVLWRAEVDLRLAMEEVTG
jgi:hypothetical protein